MREQQKAREVGRSKPVAKRRSKALVQPATVRSAPVQPAPVQPAPGVTATRGRTRTRNSTARGGRISARRSVFNVLVVSFAAALIATMSIPAFAVNDPSGSNGAAFETSAIDGLKQAHAQSLLVSQSVPAVAVSRDMVAATSEADLQAQKAAEAQRALDAANAAKAAQSGVFSASGASLSASADARQLAQTLMAAYQAGTFTDYQPAVITREIGPIADGVYSSQCAIDTRILQILVLTLNQFGSVGISDLNRPCLGSSENCPASSHCTAPARAVDFTNIGGRTITGADSGSIQLLRFLDALVPAGSNVGQSQCRSSAGTSIELRNMAQFADSCSHQHLDIPL
ncbi:MAG: hypothetical protein ABI255_09730 [Microbacteriaceae bacterium]